jgi:PTH1 family peptidyl-tRNA hydrolase
VAEADASSTMKHVVIVGLGNPGIRYAKTRHNMGYLVVKALAERSGFPFRNEPRFNGYAAKGVIAQTMVHLLLPTTYMNLSGIAIQRYLNFYKFGPQQAIIVTDDVALDYGELRVRDSGTSGGHNGLKSVEAALGTRDYVRLRMGVGASQPSQTGGLSLADYVLEPFTGTEMASLKEFINKGVEVLEQLIKEPITRVMNATNKKQKGKLGEEKHES